MKATVTLTLFLIVLLSSTIGAQYTCVKANPISIPQVPSIQGAPLNTFHGYVNSTVEFRITVNMFIDSPILTSVSYSIDGSALVNVTDLKVTVYEDYGPTKIDFKTYTTNIFLNDLSEGNHKLVAHANEMNLSNSLTVNSFYHLTSLNVISPNDQLYSNSVPLNFEFTGSIKNAHYYIYRGQERILDKPLTANMTIDNLSDGFYDLYIFVTTEYGQDSETRHFLVIGNPTQYILILIVITVLMTSGLIVFFRKRRQKRVK